MPSEQLWRFCKLTGSDSNDAIALTTLDSRPVQPNAEELPVETSLHNNDDDVATASVMVNVDDVIRPVGPSHTVSAPRFGLPLPRGHPLVTAESIELVETVV